MRAAIEEADLIAAEDTRVTMQLLNHWGIKKPMLSCHRHNEEDKAPQIIERMIAEDITVATYRKNKRPFHPSPTALDRS
nr:hypothetical protein [Enterobacter hormaechei]